MTENNLIKTFKLVKNDPEFAERVMAACWMSNLEYSDDVLRHVATDPQVLLNCAILEGTGITSIGVSDTEIINAVGGYTNV